MNASRLWRMLRFASITPVLRTTDVGRSMRWYSDILGFIAEPRPAEAPHQSCLLARDGARLMLRRAPAPVTAMPRALREGDWDVYLQLDGGELAALLDAARCRTPLVRGPEVMPGGVVEFELEDPDGHRVCVAEALADVSAFPPAVP